MLDEERRDVNDGEDSAMKCWMKRGPGDVRAGRGHSQNGAVQASVTDQLTVLREANERKHHCSLSPILPL